VWRRRREAGDFEDEIQAHVEMETERLIGVGVGADEAHRRALVQFGNVIRSTERFHERSRPLWFSDWVQDFRYGVRTLLKSPGFSLVALVTLALGIGATSAIFSFVDGVLLKPLPYSQPERIVLLWEKPPGHLRNTTSTLTFLDWKKNNDVFESMAAGIYDSMSLSGVDEPVEIPTARVTAAYFDIYGAHAAIGRTFGADDEKPGNKNVVVLSHAAWLNRFGADPQILGHKLILDGRPYTVIGVLPESSAFDRGLEEIWRPLVFQPEEWTRNFRWLRVAARLKPGVTLERARHAMDAIGAGIAADHPETNKGWGVYVEHYSDASIPPPLRQSLYLLFSAVGALLLIGCANLANLLLARGSARGREVAIRAAIGAGRGRLVRQFLAENIVIALAGGIAGLAVGYATMLGMKTVFPPYSLPREANVAMDTRVLLFTLMLSIITGIVFGLAPAFHGTNPDLVKAMKGGGRGSSNDVRPGKLRSALVVGEVALAFILVAGAGLLARSFFRMMDVNTGFDATNVLTAGLPIPDSSKYANEDLLAGYIREIVNRVDAIPGVREAAVTSALPMRGGYGMPYRVAGRPAVDRWQGRPAALKMVGAAYFHTLGMKWIRGRGFSDQDVKEAPPVMVINQTMAKTTFGNQDPIGQRILVSKIISAGRRLGDDTAWEIVGVVGDEMVGPPDGTEGDVMYVPFKQDPTARVSLVVRGAIDAAALQQSILRAVHDVNKDQPVSYVETLEQIKADTLASHRLQTTLLGIFASLALLLSGAGVYGVISYTVVQRTHEIGIRAALGAGRGSLLRLVLKNGMGLTVLGLSIGIAATLLLSRLLAGLLFSVTAHDPVTLAAAALAVVFVALLGCYIPARRASRLGVLAAIRAE
jgi:putative ABC transport system permease protein